MDNEKKNSSTTLKVCGFSGERYAKRRIEELIAKYEEIKNSLNHFVNLPTDLKPPSLLSTLRCLGELKKNTKKNKVMTVICFHAN